jgi:hypothetical protein
MPASHSLTSRILRNRCRQDARAPKNCTLCVVSVSAKFATGELQFIGSNLFPINFARDSKSLSSRINKLKFVGHLKSSKNRSFSAKRFRAGEPPFRAKQNDLK